MDADSWVNISNALQYGVIGLGFLLALMATVLIIKEQKNEAPRKGILFTIIAFMIFSLALVYIGMHAEKRENHVNLDQANDINIDAETPCGLPMGAGGTEITLDKSSPQSSTLILKGTKGELTVYLLDPGTNEAKFSINGNVKETVKLRHEFIETNGGCEYVILFKSQSKPASNAMISVTAKEK